MWSGRQLGKSYITPKFEVLPAHIQTRARDSYELLKKNPKHPSLQFKHVKNGAFRSVRVSLGYRAIGGRLFSSTDASGIGILGVNMPTLQDPDVSSGI